MLLKDKVALITGGGNGIGRAIVLRFLQDGAKVVTVDLDQAGLEETLKEAGQAGGQVRGEVANITKREEVQRVVDSIVNEHGRLDILINNAGITRDALTTKVKDGEVKYMTDEQWDAVLEVNLKGTWLCSQIAAAAMIKQKYGRIVSTASVAAIGHMGQSNYAASKAGVVAVTQTLALELARFNIAVNCIAPGG
ncbi:MAG: 3-oxoacyl-ACP reductase, partial [Chloroflexi bacterium]|nr:3-oxoacyl-ACP reductase [Chloroflexota bacterium]